MMSQAYNRGNIIMDQGDYNMNFDPFNPFNWFALYLGVVYGATQTLFGIGNPTPMSRDDLGRPWRR
jgi:hypothetical protein